MKTAGKESEIDWSKAPEGCLGAVQRKSGSDNYEYGIFVTKTDGFMENDYHFCGRTDVGPTMYFYDFIPKPSQPVFTQEMADNGELPEVGMEVLARYNFDSKQVTHQGVVLYASKLHVILNTIHCNEWHGLIGDYVIEPIDTRTDKEKAIDDLFNLDESICNDIEWHKNFLQAIKENKIHGVKWVGE
tara:strand:- start:4642 stop:5202 length:561 start_codon:yes stop_codon:yes gene_type:complete